MADFDMNQLSKELHRRGLEPDAMRQVHTIAPNDVWGADLMVPLGQIKGIESLNRGYVYVLLVEDIHSRFVWYRNLRTKDASEVLKAFSSIVEEALEMRGKRKELPGHLWTDQGTEFTNKMFKSYLSGLGINHYHSYGTHKVAHVERLIRTLRGMLFQELTVAQAHNWVDFIGPVVELYNNRKHRSIKTTPLKAYMGEPIIQEISTLERKHWDPKKTKALEVGQLVRIRRQKDLFEKDSTARWTMELFRIRAVQTHSHPITYLIEDLAKQPYLGAFYRHDIEPTEQSEEDGLVEKIVKRRRKKVAGVWQNQVLIKWMGWPEKFNSWEPETALHDV